MFCRYFQHALPRTVARMSARGQWQIAQPDRILLHRTPVVGIELALKHPANPVHLLADIFNRHDG